MQYPRNVILFPDLLVTDAKFIMVQIGHSTDVAKIGRFARYLREVFRADADAATLRLAAETLGRLVAAGGALTADVVEQEVLGTGHCQIARRMSNEYLGLLADMVGQPRSSWQYITALHCQSLPSECNKQLRIISAPLIKIPFNVVGRRSASQWTG